MKVSVEERMRRVKRAFNEFVRRGDELMAHFSKEAGLREPTRPTISAIQNVVIKFYQIPLNSMKTKSRPSRIAHPRQIAMHLCRELTQFSLEEIGKAFGGRDHATVVFATERVTARIANEQALAFDVVKLRDLCKAKLEKIEHPLFDMSEYTKV